jgi:hypothetical protein
VHTFSLFRLLIEELCARICNSNFQKSSALAFRRRRQFAPILDAFCEALSPLRFSSANLAVSHVTFFLGRSANNSKLPGLWLQWPGLETIYLHTLWECLKSIPSHLCLAGPAGGGGGYPSAQVLKEEQAVEKGLCPELEMRCPRVSQVRTSEDYHDHDVLLVSGKRHKALRFPQLTLGVGALPSGSCLDLCFLM